MLEEADAERAVEEVDAETTPKHAVSASPDGRKKLTAVQRVAGDGCGDFGAETTATFGNRGLEGGFAVGKSSTQGPIAFDAASTAVFQKKGLGFRV